MLVFAATIFTCVAGFTEEKTNPARSCKRGHGVAGDFSLMEDSPPIEAGAHVVSIAVPFIVHPRAS